MRQYLLMRRLALYPAPVRLPRRRRNPPPPAKWAEQKRNMNRFLTGEVMQLKKAALDAGAEEALFPSDRVLGNLVPSAAEVIAASTHADMTEESRFYEDAVELVQDLFSPLVAPLYENENPDVRRLAHAFVRTVASKVETLREPAREQLKSLGLGPPVDEEEDIEAEIEGRIAAGEGEEDDEEGDDPEAALRARLKKIEEEEAKLKKRQQSARVQQGGRTKAEKLAPSDDPLIGFSEFIASKRRTDVRPPPGMLDMAKSDVLVYALTDGTAQVWAKGAITHTFKARGQGRDSVTIALQFSNAWRKSGKKSREKSRILLGVEGSEDFRVMASSLAEAEKPKTRVESLEEMAKRLAGVKLTNPHRLAPFEFRALQRMRLNPFFGRRR